MTPIQRRPRSRHGSAVVSYPSDLEIVVTRVFDAPIELVFDVFTKPEHVRKHLAPFDEKVTVCSIDLRVGGDSHFVFVTEDGRECSFRGTYLEIEPPFRLAGTWIFDGWPGVEARESLDLNETDGTTTLTWKLAFPDKAARAHWTDTRGLEANFDKVEDVLRELVDLQATALGR
ncbi:MAG TPA: SRPBCC domain-containing protein [Solirubrobacteraceae bacterium]|nr:SRPBCC domain-containing protein [Solirubrobacteraceae bacterium]